MTTETSTEASTETSQHSEKKRITVDFLPRAHTCSNTLHFPRGSLLFPLPPQEELFNLYDYAFKNTYFGVM